MAKWAAWALRWQAAGRQVCFAFNNDNIDPGRTLPAAILDCRSLGAALRQKGVWPHA